MLGQRKGKHFSEKCADGDRETKQENQEEEQKLKPFSSVSL